MNVVFRVDASIRIGTGHVMRCLTLAEELRQFGHNCRFICRDHSGHLGAFIKSKGFELHLLAKPVSKSISTKKEPHPAHSEWLGVDWQRDADETRNILNKLMFDWLVVDHYALDVKWESEMEFVVGRIMVLDDLADRNHNCSLLLDQNLGRNLTDYDSRLPSDSIKLIGPKYALLRPEFSMLRERSLQRRTEPELKRILISLGGSDKDNMTGQILNLLRKTNLPRCTELDIIMGASAPHLEEVKRCALSLPFVTSVSVNVGNMAKRMCLADVSIGAVGSTSWERCCLGLPAIAMVTAENQQSAAKAIERCGAALIEEKCEMIVDIINDLLVGDNVSRMFRSMTKAGSELIDGKGCYRVAKKLCSVGSRT